MTNRFAHLIFLLILGGLFIVASLVNAEQPVTPKKPVIEQRPVQTQPRVFKEEDLKISRHETSKTLTLSK